MLRRGFTLIELLVVIAILGILAGLITGNFFTSLKKGRDARRKQDLENIQKGLELYYEDNKAYPSAITSGSALCHPNGCGTRTYMQKVPSDPSGFTYKYIPDATTYSYYKLYSCIESSLDQGAGVVQSGYSGTDCACSGTSICKFGVSSTNTSP